MSAGLAQRLVQAEFLGFDELDSTNAEARRRAEAGETGPLWITARRQTQGKGRRGRVWESVSDNLAATLLFTTGKTPAEAAKTSFIAALAVADLVETYVPAGLVFLKWPNDVQLAGRKVSGVLIESGRTPDRDGLWMAVGVGVNLATAPQSVERPATAIAEHLGPDHLTPPSPKAAASLLRARFAHHMGVWQDQGFGAVIAEWTARATGLGHACEARLDGETVLGVALGLEADGALRLRLDDGSIRRISAGEVFFQGGGDAAGR